MTIATFLIAWFVIAAILAPFVGRMLRTRRQRTFSPEERAEWSARVEEALH